MKKTSESPKKDINKSGCTDGNGDSFDGWYPSFMSPGSQEGHISKMGQAFFMNGCDIGKRTFMSRTFTITNQ
jgi:hypothetical protein